MAGRHPCTHMHVPKALPGPGNHVVASCMHWGAKNPPPHDAGKGWLSPQKHVVPEVSELCYCVLDGWQAPLHPYACSQSVARPGHHVVASCMHWGAKNTPPHDAGKGWLSPQKHVVPEASELCYCVLDGWQAPLHPYACSQSVARPGHHVV